MSSMSAFRKSAARGSALLLSLLCLLTALANASEQPRQKPTDVPASVIAHLPLPQASGNQMLLQKENGKRYLYVQQAAKQGFMIVDVSNPESAGPFEANGGIESGDRREPANRESRMWPSRKLQKRRRRL